MLPPTYTVSKIDSQMRLKRAPIRNLTLLLSYGERRGADLLARADDGPSRGFPRLTQQEKQPSMRPPRTEVIMIDDFKFDRPRRQNLPPSFGQLRVQTGWRSSWTHIVGGNFSGAHDDCLLFYEGSTGFAEIYQTDGHGNISLLRQHPDLGRIGSRSHRWTHVVAGRFSNSPNNSLLLADRNAGFAAIFNPDASGNLIKLREYPNWGAWTHVTIVRVVNSPYSAVLRYDRATGTGDILECDGHGQLTLRQRGEGWRTTWSHVVGGFATGNSVLFYEETTGHCEFYQLTYNPKDESSDVTSLGNIASIELPPRASIVVGGSFGLDAGYALYFPESGLLQFLFAIDFANNSIITDERYDGLGDQWDLIVPGGFWTPDEEDYHFRDGRFSSLLFYDREAGLGEFFLHAPFGAYVHAPLEGYTSRGSVRPGEPIQFFVSSSVGPFAMGIYRLAAEREFMTDLLTLSSGAHPLPIRTRDYRDGPSWEPAATLRVPDDWPSGLYVAHVSAGLDQLGGAGSAGATARLSGPVSGQYGLDIPFVVRAREPGSQSRILVFVNDTTYDAYNFWGRSLYGFRCFGSSIYTSPGAGGGLMPWAFRVSFRRPFIGEPPFIGTKWTYWEEPLAKWLSRLEIDVEWATLVDLHNDPALLDRYSMVVSTGHSEYFSNEMYSRLLVFIARGGNAAFFSGNNCWWRIRIEDGGATMVCYKERTFDPVAAPIPFGRTEQTINWTEHESGALVGTTLGSVLAPAPTAPDGSHLRDDINGETAHFVVCAPEHWVFAGTDLQEGDSFGTFGDGGTVVGYETDIATGERDHSWTTLADVRFASEAKQASDPPEIATMMISEKAGAVFTASTVDWTRGLSQNADSWSAVDQITLNIFVRFAGLGPACDIVGFDSNGAVQVDRTNLGWRSSWKKMIAGAFTRTDRDQIVLYDPAGGALAIVGFDGTGRANLDRTDDTVGSNWTTVIAGNFIGNGRKQVLLYDKSSGDTLLVGFDGAGAINLRRALSGWRTSWDLIVVGNFIGNGRDQVLLYDRADGVADIVGFDGHGAVNLDTSNTGWRPSWDWMVPGRFFGNKTSEVWLCDRGGHVAEIVAFDAGGHFHTLQTLEPFGTNDGGAIAGDFLGLNRQQLMRYYDQSGGSGDVIGFADSLLDVVAGDWEQRPWDLLAAGRFKGTSRTEFLLYTASQGSAAMYGLDPNGNISRIQDFNGWRGSWVMAVSGRFLGNGRDQLALYDRGRF
jgi:hypothetical protein